jgi:hypothetical protein
VNKPLDIEKLGISGKMTAAADAYTNTAAMTFNHGVLGSSPSGLTNKIKHFLAKRARFPWR